MRNGPPANAAKSLPEEPKVINKKYKWYDSIKRTRWKHILSPNDNNIKLKYLQNKKKKKIFSIHYLLGSHIKEVVRFQFPKNFCYELIY